MTNHAGFGAAAVLREAVIQDAVTIFHRAGILPSRFEGSEHLAEPGSAPDTEPTWLHYSFFLDTPKINLSAGWPTARIDVQLFGTVTLVRPDPTNETTGRGAPEQFRVHVRGRLRVGPRAVNDGGVLRLGLDFGQLEIEHHEVGLWEGTRLPTWLADLANSGLARLALKAQLRERLGSLPASPPVLDQVMCQLDALGLRITRTTFRMLDGALAVGVGLAGTEPSSMLRLDGSTGSLSDFCSPGTNAAFCVHPEVVLLLLLQRRAEAEARAQAQDVEIEDLHVSLEDAGRGHATGFVRIEGRARRGWIRVSFEMLIRPVVYTARVGIELLSVNVTGGWAILLAAFRSILGPIFNRVARALDRGVSAAVTLNQPVVITLPGTTGPSINLRTDVARIGSGGLDVAISVRTNFTREVRIAGPATIGPTDGPVARFTLVGLSSIVHADDPSPLVQWKMRRLDRESLVLASTASARFEGALTTYLDTATRVWGTPRGTRFEIACRVYRNQAGTTDELYQGAMRVDVADPLDRSHPFVRWRHSVLRPFVTPDPRPGAGNRVEYGVVHRRSKIHRTAVPGRCRFAHLYSHHVRAVPDPRFPDSPALEYLDELPFPRDQLVRNRRLLCDYCFFGGPTRTVPLI